MTAALFVAAIGPLPHAFAQSSDALPSPALAFTDSRSDREARRAYNLGRQAFENGDGDAARAQFSRAHELSALPELIYFVARAEQLRGDRDAARRLYEELLTGYADAELRRDAEARLHAMRAVVAPTTAPAVVRSENAQTGVILHPIAQPRGNETHDSDVTSEWWFWTAIAVGVVAVGAGVGLAVHFSSNPTISDPPVEGNIRGQSILQY